MKTSYYTKLAGTSFRQDAIAKMKVGKTFLRAIAEPENEYDKFAVRVEALLDDGWEMIGYFAKGKNQTIQAELLNGGSVDVVLSGVTGLDKKTLGVNVGVTYGDDSGIDPADMRDFEVQKVAYGDADVVYFDTINHRAYDENGKELLSGSRAEKLLAGEANLSFAAKAMSKTTGAKAEDIMALWDKNRDLSADLGTLIHNALDHYYKYGDVMRKIDENKEREHTAKNWMPDYLGDIVDKFIKTSGITLAETEIRIKWGNRTGIVDNLARTGEGFTLNDYKVTNEIKQVKYKGLGKKSKYTVQQNYYREILEEAGLHIAKMYLWQWDGKDWTRHELTKENVKELIS